MVPDIDVLGNRFDESQKLTQELFLDMNQPLHEKGKKVDYNYSTETLNASSSAAQTTTPGYGMPPNYFARQSAPGSVRPTMAEPVRSAPLAGQTAASVAVPVRPIRPVHW